MNRRFVNLVVANYNRNMHFLHRLDVSKHLFYPSTAEAEAAHAKEKESNNGGTGGGKPKPPRIKRLQQLPAPITGFESSPRPTSDPNRRFWDSSILHANGAGHASLYDVCSRSVISVPDLGNPIGYQHIPFAIAGDGEDEEERLYVMCSYGYDFAVLHFGGGASSLKWQTLPSPPLDFSCHFHVSAVLDDGEAICVSSMSEGTGTFCFDTTRREWWHAGDWTLPFYGRAEHVPELDTWVGFSPDYPYHLGAADLSSVNETILFEGPVPAPVLQHVWEDFDPPPTEETSIVLNKRFPGIVHTTTVEWSPWQLHLVNLGPGRFYVAKEFEAEETVSLSCCLSDDDVPKFKDRLTMLVGVEVVRDGGEGGGLRMVKHKTRRFVFPDNRIKWVFWITMRRV